MSFLESALRRGSHSSLVLDVAFSLVLVCATCVVAYLVVDRSAVVNVLVVLAGYLLLSCAERVLPTAGPNKPSRTWWMHLQLNAVNLAIGLPIAALISSYLSVVLAPRLGVDLGLIDLRLDSWGGILGLFCAVLIGTIAADFFYYWFHRAMHRSTFLWQHHKMHHLDPEFDALTGLRFNWLEHVLFGVFVLVPNTVFLKVRHGSFVDVGIANSIVLFILVMLKHINHSNLRIQFGRASFLWMSSQTHRIHHSRLPEHRDKNFAAFFRCGTSCLERIMPLDGMNFPQRAWKASATSSRSGRRRYTLCASGGNCFADSGSVAFFEPAGAKIVFGNASADAPATFVAFYLMGPEGRQLIEMLE